MILLIYQFLNLVLFYFKFFATVKYKKIIIFFPLLHPGILLLMLNLINNFFFEKLLTIKKSKTFSRFYLNFFNLLNQSSFKIHSNHIPTIKSNESISLDISTEMQKIQTKINNFLFNNLLLKLKYANIFQ